MLRLPTIFIREHRALETLLNRFNFIGGPYILIIMNNAALTVTVGGQIVVIVFKTQLGLVSMLLISLVAFLAAGFLIISYFEFGQLNENSKACINSWKQNVRLCQRDDMQVLIRQIRSLRVCRIQLGSFGYYKKANSMRVILRIFYYTVKGLMVMTKFV